MAARKTAAAGVVFDRSLPTSPGKKQLRRNM
jgi:hypothetical protein